MRRARKRETKREKEISRVTGARCEMKTWRNIVLQIVSKNENQEFLESKEKRLTLTSIYTINIDPYT